MSISAACLHRENVTKVLVLAPMTVATGESMSSIEGNDWAMVYTDWVQHWRGNHVFMTFYIFSALPCHFCLLTGGKSEMLFFFPLSIMPFSPSKCNSDWVVVGGHLKWTPQRGCLGNEIAFAMAFCYVAPQCILMISGTWLSTAGFTQLHKSNQIYHTFTAIACDLSCVSFLLVFLLVCPNLLLLWRSYKIPVTINTAVRLVSLF